MAYYTMWLLEVCARNEYLKKYDSRLRILFLSRAGFKPSGAHETEIQCWTPDATGMREDDNISDKSRENVT